MYLKLIQNSSAKIWLKKSHFLKNACILCEINNFQYRSSSVVSKSNEVKVDLNKIPISNIRNFGIIAHVDHGKSTLSDRLMEYTGTISSSKKNEQVLDRLQVERERGITVKAQTVSLVYNYKGQTYLLNLIDTPGHVDFSYEVNRSLAACQGVVLLVDANQGVQAQTVANFNLAYGHELEIIPVLNKIDLKNAVPEVVSTQINSVFGIEHKDILKVSAKFGTGVKELIEAIIERIPPPTGDLNKPFRGLLYDSWYSPYRGAICMFLIVDGSIKVGDIITNASTTNCFQVKELGILYPDEVSVGHLQAGQTGYLAASIKDSKEARIGHTWFLQGTRVESLPEVSSSKPMVFAGIYPSDQSKIQELRKAIEKLVLNDSSVNLVIESNPALGQGWRLGFLGLLHMEVFCQRLDQEFNAQVIVTAPSVPYKVKITGVKNKKMYGGEEVTITNPLKFPDPLIIAESFEPMVLGTVITPNSYYSKILKLCIERRGVQKNSQNIDDQNTMLIYEFPLSEIIVDFFDELKSISSGFASFDYEEIGYRTSSLVKMEILLNSKVIEDLTVICHASRAQTLGRSMCLSLKENIQPHIFQIAIQATVGKKVLARENIKALRKNVTAKLYGGDVTRRMKLLQYQSEGKKRMRMIGNIEVPRDTFIKVLRTRR